MINEEFGKSLISTFNDPVGHGVHLLFNEWWQHASESAKDSYVTMINSDPHFAAFSQGDLYAEPIDFAAPKMVNLYVRQSFDTAHLLNQSQYKLRLPDDPSRERPTQEHSND